MAANRTVVLDTNVVVRLILPTSSATVLYRELTKAGYRIAITPQILAEVQRTMLTKVPLRKWLNVTDNDIRAFISSITTISDVLPGMRQAHGVVKDDPEDDKIIAAALEADATYIVTDDQHLLRLKRYRGIEIITPARLIEKLKRKT